MRSYQADSQSLWERVVFGVKWVFERELGSSYQNFKISIKIKYDKETDILCIRLKDVAIDESEEDKKGIVLDYSADGQLVGIEVSNAPKLTDQPDKIEYELA